MSGRTRLVSIFRRHLRDRRHLPSSQICNQPMFTVISQLQIPYYFQTQYYTSMLEIF